MLNCIISAFVNSEKGKFHMGEKKVTEGFMGEVRLNLNH